MKGPNLFQTMTSTFKIFISDPHSIFREGIKKVVDSKPGFTVIGEADSPKNLIESFQKDTPDLLFIYTIPLKSGIEYAGPIMQAFPNMSVVLLTSDVKHPDLITAIKKGFHVIINKATTESELYNAIEMLSNGLAYYSQEVMPYILSKQQDHAVNLDREERKSQWTPREKSILKLICKGYNNDEISDFLILKSRTIEGHKSRMIEKAGVPNTINLVLFALKNKLVNIGDL